MVSPLNVNLGDLTRAPGRDRHPRELPSKRLPPGVPRPEALFSPVPHFTFAPPVGSPGWRPPASRGLRSVVPSCLPWAPARRCLVSLCRPPRVTRHFLHRQSQPGGLCSGATPTVCCGWWAHPWPTQSSRLDSLEPHTDESRGPQWHFHLISCLCTTDKLPLSVPHHSLHMQTDCPFPPAARDLAGLSLHRPWSHVTLLHCRWVLSSAACSLMLGPCWQHLPTEPFGIRGVFPGHLWLAPVLRRKNGLQVRAWDSRP